ncbi:hypothetical protein HZC35_01210 [Candidatus Saganbacteria bacterium]|nr:hypothetical protein [Candidatus Saganbacteria bacterium]
MSKVAKLLLLALICSLLVSPHDDAQAAKKKALRKTRRFYYRKRTPFKAYQEYFISPTIKETDMPVIEEVLKDRGVLSIKFDLPDNSLILQFKAAEVTALDLMMALKDLGYTVTRIN